MASKKDPTEAICKKAAALAAVEGAACNQTSYKTGKNSFLFIGPGAKGIGFKAMFKLEASMAQARKLAADEPDRFEVGTTGWVTTRFSAEEPLPKTIWEPWLKESHELAATPKGRAKTTATKKATTKKRSARKR